MTEPTVVEDENLYRCPISTPFAADKPKLTKKIYSLIYKNVTADKKRGIVKGIKEVTKCVRKATEKKDKDIKKSLIVLGADVSPYDVVSHLPVMLEEAGVPYVWVPSRKDLGAATNCKRATSVVLLKPREETEESLAKCLKAVEELNNADADGADE